MVDRARGSDCDSVAGASAAAHDLARKRGDPPGIPHQRVAGTVAIALTTALPDGPLGEEPGWRGYALPALQRDASPLTAALLVGVAWSAWHIPLLAAVPGLRFQMPLSAYLAPFTVALVAQSIFHTWLHNASGGGVPVAVVAHSAANATVLVAVGEGLPDLLEPDHARRSVYAFAGAWVLVALAIAAGTRGRPGHPAPCARRALAHAMSFFPGGGRIR